MSRHSAAVYRALFTVARAPPVVPTPIPAPEPVVVAFAGGEEEPMDLESPTPTPSAPIPVAVSIPQVDALVPPAAPTPVLGILNTNRKICKRTDTDVAFTWEYSRVLIFHREHKCTN